MKKIKDFIKGHEFLYQTIFFIWGVFRIFRVKRIFGKIKHDLPEGKKPKIIILSLRTIPTTNLVYFDAIFGHAFKKLGCDVKMLYCDGVLDSCDADTIFRNQKPQCFLCKNLGCLVKNSLNLDCVSFQQYISKSEIKEIEKIAASLSKEQLLNQRYLGVNVGIHARASAIRYFLFGKLDLNDPVQVAMLRKKNVYAMIVTRIAENLVLKEKPNILFMLHGIYSTWGSFLEYFRLKNIETVLYNNMPPRFGHFLFNRNSRINEIVAKEEWAKFSRSLLTPEQGAQLNVYFGQRFKERASDQDLYEKNYSTKIKKKSLLEFLSKKKYSRRYVLYPNLAWDVDIEGKVSDIFEDIFSWIDITIEFFKNKKDYQLIIKPHPGELIWDQCSVGIADYIKQKHAPLPGNITILAADVPLKAYDLITPGTVCLTFNGTIGLESAISGVPALVVAATHYKEAGIVYEIKSLNEYLELLDNPKDVIAFAKNNVQLARKYAYFYFFKSMVRIPFYKDDRWSVIDWEAVGDIGKLLDDDSNVIKICKKIIEKKDVINPL